MRAEEDSSMDTEWRDAVVTRLRQLSTLIERVAASNSTRAAALSNPTAAGRELRSLEMELVRLREGRRVLEAELQRRMTASFSDSVADSSFGEGCALCKVCCLQRWHVPASGAVEPVL
jgi:hypothetical protein